MANKKPGEIIAKRIESKGYHSFSQFRRDFLKKAPVTLSHSTLSLYIHGNVPSKERFDALTDFLGFSKKEKENLEAMYHKDMRSCTPYFPSGKKKTRAKETKPRKKGFRMDIPKKTWREKMETQNQQEKSWFCEETKSPCCHQTFFI
jgi:hypothetical protein